MKNKLTGLSILALALLIGAGALILAFNPFNGSAFNLTNPIHHGVGGNLASSPGSHGTSSTAPVISPSSGTHHVGDDGTSGNDGLESQDG